jgi:hypothetical protein
MAFHRRLLNQSVIHLNVEMHIGLKELTFITNGLITRDIQIFWNMTLSKKLIQT